MKVAFAGGGTGGHVSPALGLAEAVAGGGGKTLFLCSFRSAPAFAARLSGLKWENVPSAPFRLKSPWSLPRSLAANWTGYRRSLRLLEDFSPAVLVATGGYPSVPPALAAGKLGIPVVLYEANTSLGKANRLLLARARGVLRALPPEDGGGKNLLVVPAVPAAALAGERAKRSEAGSLTLLVMGGSHGARDVNRLVVSCLPAWYGYEERLKFIHLCGTGMEEGIAEAYREVGFPARVVPFAERMGEIYAAADLVVSRAGAASLAEILRWKLPAILVPYPYATDDHQERNARCLERAGAALVCPQGKDAGRRLAHLVEELAGNPGRCREMAAAAGKVISPEFPSALEGLQLLLRGS